MRQYGILVLVREAPAMDCLNWDVYLLNLASMAAFAAALVAALTLFRSSSSPASSRS